MKDEKDKIYQRLVADSTLTNLLAANTPFYNPNGASAKTNSIIPAGKATGETNGPFVTIQNGNETKLGTKLYDLFVYIRVYDSTQKSYTQIQAILERIKVLLDGYEFSFNSSALVQAKYDNTVSETVDESLNMNFQESRYRLLLL